MTETDLTYLTKQIERVLTEQREIRREMQMIRGETQIIRSIIYRNEDTLTEVLDRLLRKTEDR